jgi:hypothetical protein
MKACDKLILLNRCANNREERARVCVSVCLCASHACLSDDIRQATITAAKSEMPNELVILSKLKGWRANTRSCHMSLFIAVAF